MFDTLAAEGTVHTTEILIIGTNLAIVTATIALTIVTAFADNAIVKIVSLFAPNKLRKVEHGYTPRHLRTNVLPTGSPKHHNGAYDATHSPEAFFPVEK